MTYHHRQLLDYIRNTSFRTIDGNASRNRLDHASHNDGGPGTVSRTWRTQSARQTGIIRFHTAKLFCLNRKVLPQHASAFPER